MLNGELPGALGYASEHLRAGYDVQLCSAAPPR